MSDRPTSCCVLFERHPWNDHYALFSVALVVSGFDGLACLIELLRRDWRRIGALPHACHRSVGSCFWRGPQTGAAVAFRCLAEPPATNRAPGAKPSSKPRQGPAFKLILFKSDNGGNAESGPKSRTDGDPTQAASNWFCGENWAFLEPPFRKYKHYNHEGGIATPLIAHWPSGIAAKNEPRHQPGHLIDIMATCVDVGGASYPKKHNGKPITPMQGKSLSTAFKNETIGREALFWEHEGNAVVRIDDLKLVRIGRSGPWELYELKTDRTEQHDLATAQPEKAKELAAEWQKWAESAQVLPYPGEGKAKKKGKGKKKAE